MKNTIKLFAIGIMTILLSFEASLSFSQNKGNGIKKGSVYISSYVRPEQGAMGGPAWKFQTIVLSFDGNSKAIGKAFFCLIAIDTYTGGLGDFIWSDSSEESSCSYKEKDGLVYVWEPETYATEPKDESGYLFILSVKDNGNLEPIKTLEKSFNNMTDFVFISNESKLSEAAMRNALSKLLRLKDQKTKLQRSIELKQIEKERQLELAYQQAEIDYSDTTIYQMVEIMPEFPGGEQKLLQYISKNVKYPQIARESGIKGRVFVSFVIEPNGSVSNVKVLKGGIGGGCDEEAMRVVKAMPKWKPGIQNGKAVRVSYIIPINFSMQ